MRFWMREALHMNEEEFLPDKEDMAVNELGTMLHDVLECFCREHAALKDGMEAAALQDAITEILEQTFGNNTAPRPSCPCCCKNAPWSRGFPFTPSSICRTFRKAGPASPLNTRWKTGPWAASP